MKIQELAIIFIIIILPISLLLSEYTQFQIQTLKTQTVYDSKLTVATYDAIQAFQLNAINSSTSGLANSKLRDIEASVSTFRNSIMSAFKLNGYTEDALNNYIPALVYTLYDGFYIYSPYENENHRYEVQKDAEGNEVLDSNGDPIYTDEKADGNGQSLYGIKPYINYSCRYVKGSTDVVITYALDNHITVQGLVDGTYVNKDGYLVDDIDSNALTYNGVTIETEQLKEYLPISTGGGTPQAYPYVRYNGTKYYMVGNQIIYFMNGNRLVQCTDDSTKDDDEYDEWKALIENNNLAQHYYLQADEFTEWLKSTGLLNLTYGDAIDEVIDENGNTQITNLWPGDTREIFKDNEQNIENQLSNFNQHRLSIIRHKIETNLAIAISNYNIYSGAAATNVFQMPEIKEDEWDYITHNISLISFLQGLPIGGKIYNGYSIVTNSESEEVVLEENIFILSSNVALDGSTKYIYRKIGDKALENGGTANVDAGPYNGFRTALDLRKVQED